MSDINNTDNSLQALGLSLPDDKALATKTITQTYLDSLYQDDYVEPEKIANDLAQMVKHEFTLYNESAVPGGKWHIPSELLPEQIAMAMLHMYKIKNINCAGVNSERDYDILGIYQEDGPNAGIYVSDETEIRNLIRRYNPNITALNVKEVISRLKDKADRVVRCNDPDLIAVNNGIFNYKTKILEPFDPDLVFTAKCHVDYNPFAQNVIIHNDEDGTDWDIETWVKELFDDNSDVPETIWEIIGAIIRPNIKWGKAAWFVSEKGNNGKGTLCQLMRNITGEGSYAAIRLIDFGKEFMLEPLIGVTSVITDENDVGIFIDKVANLKAVITNDVIQINRKFKTPIAYQFKGFMVQCVNEMPRTKDKSESFYRRQIFIPFEKCYTGMERKYIKNDYLNRKEVLEYALYRVLNMNYYEIHEPESCKAALEEYKTFNDPVREFINDILPRVSWECLPKALLYDMYKGWSKINNPNVLLLSNKVFFNEVKNIVDPIKHGWYCISSWKNQKRVLKRMDGEEPLLDEYNCKAWMLNPDSTIKSHRMTVNPDKVNKSTKIIGLFKCDAIQTDDNTDKPEE